MAKSSKIYELMLKIGAKQDSSLKKACADADKNLSKLSKSAKAVGKVVAGASIAVATTVATAGVAAVKSGIDYQKQLANVSTLLTGTEAEISARTAEIGKDILKVSNDTGVETANLTDGMYQVISAFGDSKDAMSILETSAKAAAAGNATTTEGHQTRQNSLILGGDLRSATGYTSQSSKDAVQFFLLNIQRRRKWDNFADAGCQFTEGGLTESNGRKGQISDFLRRFCRNVFVALHYC